MDRTFKGVRTSALDYWAFESASGGEILIHNTVAPQYAVIIIYAKRPLL